ncbi:AraC family transcriptional regulator [Paenibacillus sanguinis]|uniref:AraC family transcriptional regulator n=1 Tax=Paenibacillus sanguinis TaxID=225906 RepID=UPI00035E4066|nr:AraC family transcriptional regulator [Paenibacillus sanguinis]
MKRLFEPVKRLQSGFWWDYKVNIERDYKGYYHWHQCCEFMLVHKGKGTVVVNQQTYEIKPGMLFLFEPYQLHQVYAEVSSEQVYVRSIFYADAQRVRACLLPFPALKGRFDHMLTAAGTSHVYELGASAMLALEEIYERYNTSSQGGAVDHAEAVALLLIQLFYWLPEDTLHSDSREERTKRPLRYAEIVMNWIEEHYAEEAIMERLAKETHLTPNYLSRVFRQETGNSITSYLIARRIGQACRLLETTDLAVEQIGQKVGYANSSYFIHLFKSETGLTPLKYRRLHF